MATRPSSEKAASRQPPEPPEADALNQLASARSSGVGRPLVVMEQLLCGALNQRGGFVRIQGHCPEPVENRRKAPDIADLLDVEVPDGRFCVHHWGVVLE